VKHVLAWALGLGSFAAFVAISVFSMIDTGTAWRSTREATGYMASALVIVWPLCVGVAGTDGVMVSRGRVGDLAAALPTRARVRLALRRLGALWLAGALGLLAALVFASIVSWRGGSHPTAMAFVGVPLALVGIVAWTLVGWVVGVLTRSWLVPPVLMLGYLMLHMTGASWSYWWARGPADMAGSVGIAVHPASRPYAASLAYLGALLLVAAALLVWWAARDGVAWVLVALTAGLLAVSLVAVHAAITAPDGTWRSDDPAGWPCAPLRDVPGLVCVPPDNPVDLDVLRAALAPIQARLLVVGGTDAAGRVWRPERVRPADSFAYDPPLGRPFDEWQAARLVVGNLGVDCPFDPADQTAMARFSWAADTLLAWLDPEAAASVAVGSADVSRADAAEAYRVLTECG